MQVSTNVLDVLPDGTITRLELTTEPMNVTICRSEADEQFMIEKVNVSDVEHMEDALAVLSDYLHEYCIYSIEVNSLQQASTECFLRSKR